MTNSERIRQKPLFAIHAAVILDGRSSADPVQTQEVLSFRKTTENEVYFSLAETFAMPPLGQ